MASEPDPESPGAQEKVLRAAREKASSAHHRVPLFYLRSFAGQNGRITILDPASGDTRSAAPRGAFAETGYYTARDEELEEMALAEVLFEDFENHGSRAYRRLLGGASPADLSVKERSYIAWLLAAQVTRGETFREMDRQMAEGVGKKILKVGAAHSEDWWDRFQADSKERGEELPDVSREDYVRFIESDEYTIRHSPELRTELMLSPLRDLAEIFFDFGWHTVHFEEPCLFSSEEPISYWRPPLPGFMGRGIGPLTSDEVRLPLSPQVALILTHPRFEFQDRAGLGGRRASAWINYWTWRFRPATPLVLCPDVPEHPLPSPVELCDDLFGSFTPGPVISR